MQTFNPGLILADTNRQWSDQEIMEEIGSMFGGVEEAYKMLSDAPSSYRTNNDNSDQTDAEFRNLDLINQVDISSVVKDFNRKDHNDNRPTSANQNMDVNVAVLFDDKSSQQSSSIINVACGTSELIASGRDNDYCCVIDRGHECGNSINDPSFVSDSCGQDEQMISVSRLLDQDFNQTSNNHIDSNQTNQDNKCKNIHENNMSHIEINNDLMGAKDLIDSINEKRCEQLNDKLDDLELYAPIAISPKMDSNCSIDIGIYSKMRGGMDTLTALPLDELHQSQQEDLNCISRDDQGDQQRQRQPGISSHNDHIELSTCDLLVAQEEEFLDQLAKFGLPNLTGSNNEPNSTNDDLKDLILGLTSANSGTITNCDFVSADHSDDYNVDQLNQDTALDGILVAQTNIKPVRPHSFELASHGIEMQQQYSLAKASSTDNGWNNIELDSNSYSLTGDFNNHKSSENENSYTLLATNQPSILKENSAKDNTLFTARENQSSSAITYRNTSFNESESKSTTLNQSFCIRNSFSRSCSAPGGTNGVIQILDYVPNWANTNGGSKVLIIGKWETVKLNYQKPSKYSGHSYRQSYYHEELSKSNSLVHSIEACSEKKTPSEDESVGFTSKSTNAFTVMFDDISVPATQIQENVLRCYAPIHEVGFVSMRVLINSCIISDEVIFEYKPLCTSRPLSTTSGEGQINNSQSIVPTHQQYRQQLSPNSIKSGSLSCATSPSSVNSAETKVLTLAENIISAMHKKNLNPRLYQSDCNHSVNTKFGECFAATTTKSHSDNNCRLPIRPSTLISPRLTSSFDSSSAGYSASNDVVGSIYHNSLSKLGNSLSLNSRDSSSSTQANDINDVTNQHQQTFENVINPSFISNTSVLISDKINDSSGTINDTGNQMQIPAPLNNGQQSNTISIQHPLSIITDSPINRNHQSYQIQQRQLQQSQNIMPSCSNTKAQMMLLTHGNGPQNISHDSQTETSSSGLGSIMSSSPSSSLHSPMSIAPIDSPCSCGHQSSGTPTSADFCEYFQASAKAEESFSCLTLSDYEQQELYEAAKVIQKAYRMYKGRKRQASDITVSIHKDTQPHHRHLHHRLLNLKHHHVPHASSYRDKEMQAATIIQAYYRRYRQYVHYRQSKQQVSNAANHMHASSSNTSKSESLSSISSVEENGLIYTHQGHQSGMNSLNGGKQQSNLQYRQKQLDHRMISSASSSTRRYSQNGLVNRSNNVCGTNETCASFIVESLDISNVSSTAYIDRKRIKTARASSLNPKSQEQSNLYRSEHQH